MMWVRVPPGPQNKFLSSSVRVERSPVKRRVTGSNPVWGANGKLVKWYHERLLIFDFGFEPRTSRCSLKWRCGATVSAGSLYLQGWGFESLHRYKKFNFFYLIYKNKKVELMKSKKESNRILTWAKKIKAINFLGGKCEMCGNDNIFHLCFHHKNPDEKDFAIRIKKDFRWSIIEKELIKCSLLCNNCHQELHFNKGVYSRLKSNKKLFLDIKNNNGCEQCGYNKQNSCLHFHHPNEKKYKFSNFGIDFKTIDNISEEILLELEKCEILCANCHQELHTDIIFFKEHEKEIIELSKNIKELTPKINRCKVKELYGNGMKQIEISKLLNCQKSTISMIIKELKLAR